MVGPGQPEPRRFREGTSLSAEDLRRIVNMLVQRMEGGNGINVRAFGNRLIIEAEVRPTGGGGVGPTQIPGDVVTIGTDTEGPEEADPTTWSVDTDRSKGLRWYIQDRDAYYHTGDEKWYGYIREVIWDRHGKLAYVGGQTRIIVDDPGTCP